MGRGVALVACLSIRQTNILVGKKTWQFKPYTYSGKWKTSPSDCMCLIKVIDRNCKPFRDEKHVPVIIHSFSSCGRVPSSSWRLRVKKGDATLACGSPGKKLQCPVGPWRGGRLHEFCEENRAVAGLTEPLCDRLFLGR